MFTATVQHQHYNAHGQPQRTSSPSIRTSFVLSNQKVSRRVSDVGETPSLDPPKELPVVVNSKSSSTCLRHASLDAFNNGVVVDNTDLLVPKNNLQRIDRVPLPRRVSDLNDFSTTGIGGVLCSSQAPLPPPPPPADSARVIQPPRNAVGMSATGPFWCLEHRAWFQQTFYPSYSSVGAANANSSHTKSVGMSTPGPFWSPEHCAWSQHTFLPFNQRINYGEDSHGVNVLPPIPYNASQHAQFNYSATPPQQPIDVLSAHFPATHQYNQCWSNGEE